MTDLDPTSKTPEPSKKRLMALGKVPPVDRIKELLGLNIAPVKVKNEFRDITVKWRKSNMTSGSRPATELLDWHSEDVQKDLRKLAENFLAEKDNAERFWSGTRSWKYDSKLQYPDDRERIIELLVQLFFKQNRYFKNNATYGQWNHKDPESDTSRDESTPQRMTSTETTWSTSGKDIESSPQQLPRREPANIAFSTITNFVDLSGSFSANPALQSEPIPQPSGDRNVYDDIYEVPDETEPVIVTPRNPSRSSGVSSKHGRSEQGSELTPPEKKAKYSLRDRKTIRNRIKNTISDNEFEDMVEQFESEDQPLSQFSPQNSPHVLKGQLPKQSEPGSSIHLSGKRLSSTVPAQKHPKDRSEGHSNSGSTQQMQPPPRPSQTISTNQSHSPKQQCRIVRLTVKGSAPSPNISPNLSAKVPAKSGSTISKPSNLSPATQNKTQRPPLPSASKPQMSGSSNYNHKASASPSPALQTNAIIETSHPLSQPTTYSPQPSSLRSPSTEVRASIVSVQPPASAQSGAGKTTHSVNPNKAPVAPMHAATEENGKSDSQPLETASSKQRPKAQMKFYILTREPRDTLVRWPEGKIQGTSLSDFIAGVAKATQRDGIEKLELTLRTATSDTKEPVYKDDEDSWVTAKNKFTERMKESRVKAKVMGMKGTADPEIHIEPFYEQVEAMDEDDEEEEIFF